MQSRLCEKWKVKEIKSHSDIKQTVSKAMISNFTKEQENLKSMEQDYRKT